ncbi:MAG TPA: branched-chain amino acid ABC transporter substrate-binding protein [Candidatus Limnocylindrales bacterium]
MRLRNLSVLATAALLVASACNSSGATPAPATTGPGASTVASAPASAPAGNVAVKIGIELPLTGGEAPNGQPTANGVALAISKLTVPGFTITIEQKDDALNGHHDPPTGAANVTALANDPAVLFVVGPYNSNVAQAEIPVSNAAGLMQCSPANTNPGLTKTWGGVDPKTLRPTHPDQIAYVRVATTDDLQGAGGADIAYNVAHAKNAYVVDDTETYGKGLADVFATDFAKLGGTVLKRDGIPTSTTDFTSYITALKGLTGLDYVYYGGVTTSGIGVFRSQMAAQSMASIPFGVGDGAVDGSAATASSFLNLAGADGDANTYGTVAATHDIPNPAQFTTDYKAMFNTEPGSYSAAGYGCTQVFLQALQAVGPADGSDLVKLRADIRAYVADSSHSYDTALGTFSFDAAGDTSQHIISYYGFDAGTKDWKFLQQRDFTANPMQ